MKNSNFITAAGLLFSFTTLLAQSPTTAAHDLNSVGIVGMENTAFGDNALSNTSFGINSGGDNTATGTSAMASNSAGNNNTANGTEALYSNTGGGVNTAIGWRSLYSNGCLNNIFDGTGNTANGHTALFSNTCGNFNTAVGADALFSNTSGDANTAEGYRALYNNSFFGSTLGKNNTAFGHSALFGNLSGIENTAFGTGALYDNNRSTLNTAAGYQALNVNNGIGPTPNRNTALGALALHNNNLGLSNTAAGYGANYNNYQGYWNTSAGYRASFLNNGSFSYANVAVGSNACFGNQVGKENVAVGANALLSTNSFQNVAVGYQAMAGNISGNNNTAFGANALLNPATSNFNTAVGANADLAWPYTFNNATAIGFGAEVGASDEMFFGNAMVNTYEGQVMPSVVSDGRFKFDISENDVKGIEFIKKLRPVVYNLDSKKLHDFLSEGMNEEQRKKRPVMDYSIITNIRQTGFIAQEVEKAAKEVDYDFSGVIKPSHERDNYSLSYSTFVVPLVKSIQQQQAMLTEQKQELDLFGHQIEDQILKLKNNASTSILEKEQNFRVGKKFEMNAYPNPFSSETLITFIIPDSHNAYLQITNLNGLSVFSLPIAGGSSNILVSSEKLSPGIYIYSIYANDKLLGSKRLIVAGK
jgi:trimeric autotransporter adhesin